MQVGASSACFFPLETEKSLQNVLDLGFKTNEVFFNTSSELEDPFVMDLKRRSDEKGASVISVHPFSSALENNCIFGEYQRRYDDFIDLYHRHCHAAALLGAKVLVIHGSFAVQKRQLTDEFYFDRFRSLIEIGKQEGVMVCQENVVRYRSQSIAFLKKMREALGSDFHMVFDVKQSIRCGYDPFEVLDTFKENIVHIHLSDNGEAGDCLPPGRGSFDFKRLFDTMNGVNYKGGYVIEIYSKGYHVKEELAQSKRFLDKF